MRRSYFVIFAAFMIVILLQGCGTSSFSVQVKKPAEINMNKFKKISVGIFTGYYDNAFAHELTTALVDTRYFEVFDWMNLDRILLENNMTVAGLGNENVPVKMRDIIGSTALISGSISRYDYNEDLKKGEPYKENDSDKDKDKDRDKDNHHDKDKDKKEIWHRDYTLDGKATVSINFQITDLTNGKIIYAKSMEKVIEQRVTAQDKHPHLDRDAMLSDARRFLINQFVRRITPHWEWMNVTFLTDKNVPDMDKGISFAKAGEWDKAIDIFLDLTKKVNDKELLSKVYYDLGTAYQYSFRFKHANDAFQEALNLYNDNRYVDAIKDNRYMEADNKKLNEQMEY